MVLSQVKAILDAEILTDNYDPDRKIGTICGSDMMSDVLAFIKHDALLLTGLCNPQVMRTAEMMDIVCITFVRGKRPPQNILDMAEDLDIVVLLSDHKMFESCGLLYQAADKEGFFNE